MLLSEFLTPDQIKLPIEAHEKSALLEELTGFLAADGSVDRERVLAAVSEREAAMSTGIGHGVAVPHGRTEGIKHLMVVAGRTSGPVPFDAPDGEPVRLVFLVAGPKSESARHVQVLGRIARLTQREDVRRALLDAPTAEAFAEVIQDAEEA